MANNKAVLHIEKGKGFGGGTGNHIDRTPGHEHTYTNADSARLHLNQDHTPEEYKRFTIPQAIALRMKSGYTSPRKIRANAVRYMETILSGSHDQMIKIQEEGRLNEWVAANKKFAEEEYGADNIIRFVLHLDETTPHIHCVTVPLTKDGRLSAKDVMGHRKEMRERQDNYALAMKPFGLERGEKNSIAVHDYASDYNKRMDIVAEKMDTLTVEGFLGINKSKTIENLEAALRTALMRLEKLEFHKNKMQAKADAAFEYRTEVSRQAEVRINHQEDQLIKADQKISILTNRLDEVTNLYKELLIDGKAISPLHGHYMKQFREAKQKGIESTPKVSLNQEQPLTKRPKGPKM